MPRTLPRTHLSDPSTTTEGILLGEALSEYSGIMSGRPTVSATDPDRATDSR